MAGTLNVQVATSASCAVALLYFVRTCSELAFLCCVVVPACLYGLYAERTFATRLRGKRVLVTGASSGLGLALAVEAARRAAAAVVLVSRTRAALEAAAVEVRAASALTGFEAVVAPCDVSDAAAVRALVDGLDHAPDVLVNNAGAGAWKHVEETSPEEALAMMACPYQAAFALTALLAPLIAARGGGHVLNVTSAASEAGFRGAVGYGTARWTMRGFSRMLVRDLCELKIGVTLLNAAEITGTDYFKDAPGKAGAASKAKIPELFQIVDRMGLNYSTTQVARAGLDAVEKGWATVLVPGFLMIPTKMIADVVPCVLEFLCTLGPSGRRPQTKPAASC